MITESRATNPNDHEEDPGTESNEVYRKNDAWSLNKIFHDIDDRKTDARHHQISVQDEKRSKHIRTEGPCCQIVSLIFMMMEISIPYKYIREK